MEVDSVAVVVIKTVRRSTTSVAEADSVAVFALSTDAERPEVTLV
ncbi:Uncharacterised protein [BD1-7 clade bacterium]|uniref:Uncharacterized protein n=1 Tax=BD1-7 clade bacterium TaxID=2029982 RepID=A0A5S9NWD7_9GAMM|nr:Uncharacterised protein [BD1-7 clade bacterium]CAA0095017.1 Uncharacterised protein [BD1-7 clade bacterium]